VLRQAQNQLEAAKAAQAYFQRALQELTLFKSKTSAALLQVGYFIIWRLCVVCSLHTAWRVVTILAAALAPALPLTACP